MQPDALPKPPACAVCSTCNGSGSRTCAGDEAGWCFDCRDRSFHDCPVCLGGGSVDPLLIATADRIATLEAQLAAEVDAACEIKDLLAEARGDAETITVELHETQAYLARIHDAAGHPSLEPLAAVQEVVAELAECRARALMYDML